MDILKEIHDMGFAEELALNALIMTKK